MSSTISSPSWGPATETWGMFSHLPNSLPPGSQTHAPALGSKGCRLKPLPPPVVTYLCRCSVSAAQSSSLGKIPKASGWSLVPSFAPPTPVLAPSAAAPSCSSPPGQPLPSSCLLSQCCVSSLKARLGTGGRGGDPRRGSASDGPAPNLGGCSGEGGAGRLLIV